MPESQLTEPLDHAAEKGGVKEMRLPRSRGRVNACELTS